MHLLYIIPILAISGTMAETKLDLKLLHDVASKMSQNRSPSFCITIFTDLYIESNIDNGGLTPLMVLDFQRSDEIMKEAQIKCPNLIIGL